jgi:hypothetical protein
MYTILTLVALLAQQPSPSAVRAAGQLDLRWKDFISNECQLDSDLGRLDVSGTLVYENGTGRTVLLLRQPHATVGERARPLNPTPADQPVYSFSSLVVSRARARPYQKEDFVALGSGESYSEPYSFSMFFARSQTEPPALPHYGDYLIQVHVSVWPDSSQAAEEIGASLGRGLVWTENLWSKPIQVELRSDLPAEACH